LNNKLRSALHEVNSLNLTVELLWNELTFDHLIKGSVTKPSSDKQENQGVFIDRNWTEEDP
jgi:hypothetical protein